MRFVKQAPVRRRGWRRRDGAGVLHARDARGGEPTRISSALTAARHAHGFAQGIQFPASGKRLRARLRQGLRRFHLRLFTGFERGERGARLRGELRGALPLAHQLEFPDGFRAFTLQLRDTDLHVRLGFHRLRGARLGFGHLRLRDRRHAARLGELFVLGVLHAKNSARRRFLGVYHQGFRFVSSRFRVRCGSTRLGEFLFPFLLRFKRVPLAFGLRLHHALQLAARLRG